MAVTPAFPYSINPNSYAQQALTPQPVTQPVMPQATPAMRGPANQALYDQLHGALQKQNAVPGLLAAYQADPALAQQAGGLLAANPGQGNPLASNFYRIGQPAAQAPAGGAPVPAGGGQPQSGAQPSPDQLAAIQAQIQALQDQAEQQAILKRWLEQIGTTSG